jgi:hypothetical protein
MNADEFKRFAARVIDLDEAQRKDLSARLRMIDNTKRNSFAEKDWLLKGICAALSDRGLLSYAAEIMLVKTKAFKAYERVAPVLRAELSQLTKGNSLDRLAYVTGIALMHFVELQGFRVSATMVMTNAAKAREALEESFPGYIQSGLLSIVLDDRAHDQLIILKGGGET